MATRMAAICGVWLGVSWTEVQAAPSRHCELLPAMQLEIERIKQAPFKAPVECQVSDRSEIRRYIESIIREDFPEERLRNEELLYKLLGFIPGDFDYYQGILALYENQLGGFYDPKKKRFTMADWVPETLQQGFLKHELTHAFQDQNYDLNSLVDVSMLTSDEVAARMALLEGDASLTARLTPENSSSDLKTRPHVLFEVGLPYGPAIPALLQNFLMFPYSAGEQFVEKLVVEGGEQALKEAFIRLPRSSEEILHPEKYREPRRDFYAAAGERGEPSEKVIFGDTLGELGLRIFAFQLGAAPPMIEKIGSGWGGDRALLFSSGRGTRTEWRIWFDSPADREEFCQFLMSERPVREGIRFSRFETKQTGGGEQRIWSAVKLERLVSEKPRKLF